MEGKKEERTGVLAKSLAGHDKGELFVIIQEDREYVFLADGKKRSIEEPKRKNKKHIQVVYRGLDHKEKLTDEEIRRWIRCYKRESQV